MQPEKREMLKSNLKAASRKVADHHYEVSDYAESGQLEHGTAETHEQISDVYMAGNNEDNL